MSKEEKEARRLAGRAKIAEAMQKRTKAQEQQQPLKENQSANKQVDLSDLLSNDLVRLQDKKNHAMMTEDVVQQIANRVAEAKAQIQNNPGLKYILKQLEKPLAEAKTSIENRQADNVSLRIQLNENKTNLQKIEKLLANVDTDAEAKANLTDRNQMYQRTINKAINDTKIILSGLNINPQDKSMGEREIQRLQKTLAAVEGVLEFKAPKIPPQAKAMVDTSVQRQQAAEKTKEPSISQTLPRRSFSG